LANHPGTSRGKAKRGRGKGGALLQEDGGKIMYVRNLKRIEAQRWGQRQRRARGQEEGCSSKEGSWEFFLSLNKNRRGSPMSLRWKLLTKRRKKSTRKNQSLFSVKGVAKGAP